MAVDQKAKKFFLVFFILIAISMSYEYYRLVMLKNYTVMMHVPCDPQTKTCFVAVCNPENEVCTGDAKQDTNYYSILHKMAYNMPDCNPLDVTCQGKLACVENENQCSVTYCNASTVDVGMRCSNELDK